MFQSIVPSLAIAAVGLFAARLSDVVLNRAAAGRCAKVEKSAVVWPYEATDDTVASFSSRNAAKRVASSSPR